MMTYWFGIADVRVEEMNKSDSKDKYVHCRCKRMTDYLTLESEQNSFEDFPEDLQMRSYRETSYIRKRIRQ